MAKEEEKTRQSKQSPVQTPPPPMGPPPKRPMLASIISIIIMIVGLLTITTGALLIAGGGMLVQLGLNVAPQFIVAFGAIILLMGVVFLGTGVGLWKLKKWALYLVAMPIVLYLGILGGSAAITQDLGPALVCAPVPIVAIVLLLYFVSIRKRFR